MKHNGPAEEAMMVHKHEKNMHPGKPLTKLAKGGVTTLSQKELGRNIAKLKNQFGKKSTRGR